MNYCFWPYLDNQGRKPYDRLRQYKAEVLQVAQRPENISTVLRPTMVSASEPNRCTLAVPKARA